MLPVVITSNEVISNIHEVEAFVAALWMCKSVKWFRRCWDIVKRRYVLIRRRALNNLLLVALVAGITSSSVTSLLTLHIISNWPGVQLRKKVIISDSTNSRYAWKFLEKISKCVGRLEAGHENENHKRSAQTVVLLHMVVLLLPWGGAIDICICLVTCNLKIMPHLIVVFHHHMKSGCRTIIEVAGKVRGDEVE